MTNKITSQVIPMTPYEVYLQQVKSTFDSFRSITSGTSYVPPQFGGIFGQGIVANSGAVMEIIEFDLGTQS